MILLVQNHFASRQVASKRSNLEWDHAQQRSRPDALSIGTAGTTSSNRGKAVSRGRFRLASQRPNLPEATSGTKPLNPKTLSDHPVWIALFQSRPKGSVVVDYPRNQDASLAEVPISADSGHQCLPRNYTIAVHTRWCSIWMPGPILRVQRKYNIRPVEASRANDHVPVHRHERRAWFPSPDAAKAANMLGPVESHPPKGPFPYSIHFHSLYAWHDVFNFKARLTLHRANFVSVTFLAGYPGVRNVSEKIERKKLKSFLDFLGKGRMFGRVLRRTFEKAVVARVNVGATSDVGQVYRPDPGRPSASHATYPREAEAQYDRAEVPLKDERASNCQRAEGIGSSRIDPQRPLILGINLRRFNGSA